MLGSASQREPVLVEEPMSIKVAPSLGGLLVLLLVRQNVVDQRPRAKAKGNQDS